MRLLTATLDRHTVARNPEQRQTVHPPLFDDALALIEAEPSHVMAVMQLGLDTATIFLSLVMLFFI